jgi:hypothetical protein
MAWKHLDVHLPVFLFGAAVLANCTSTAPPAPSGEEKCDGVWQYGDQERICRTDVGAGSTGVSGSGVGGGAAGIPNLGTGGTTGGTVPMLGGNGGSGAGTGAEAGVGNVGQGGVAGAGIGGVAGDGSAGVGNAGGAAPTGGTGGTGAAVVLGRIQVNAGTKNRDHTPVTFPFPPGAMKNIVLKDPAGAAVQVQASPADGNFTFILPTLAANQQIIYTVEQLPAAPPPGVTQVTEGNQLFFSVGTTRLFRWTYTADNFRNRAANDVRAGYIYPLYTPAGLNVADDYAEDHPHMHGVWSAWTRTTFRNHAVDFWNGYANQGHVDQKNVEGFWTGQVTGGLIANIVHDDITTTPRVTVLNERWVVTIYKTHDGAAPYFLFDVDSVQNTATTDPLVLEEYHYGGFGYRGAQEWATTVSFLTSEGHNRTSGDGQNARWCAMYGAINGRTGGYAGLGHPTNIRAPQGLRIHPSNPYWAFLPTTVLKGGRYTIAAGTPYKSRFRLVVFDGNADAALLNRLWDDFATPPTVTVLP